MLLLWIVLLAASLLLPATGEVLKSFKPCDQFFFDRQPPDLMPKNPGIICQLYRNKYQFATMYNRTGRIPLYSAYKYMPGPGVRPQKWMIEPQLALNNAPNRKSMELDRHWKTDQALLENSQAVGQDYRHGGQYDRGHLAPVSHQPDQDSKVATFTLTNIVPQYSQLNNGAWRLYEEHINAAGCLHTYIIVGAVPGNTLINKRVNVPSHIWAAGCCVSNNNNKKTSWAVIAENDKNVVVSCTLKELQARLATLYEKETITLFKNNCA